MTKLKVTLKKSVIGSTESQRATVRGLGLKKIPGLKYWSTLLLFAE